MIDVQRRHAREGAFGDLLGDELSAGCEGCGVELDKKVRGSIKEIGVWLCREIDLCGSGEV